jgi:hypothetical protein
MDPHPAERLMVKVDLMTTPCLWCWEIVHTRDGTVVESSWATDWTGYESAHEAWGAGILRLNELNRRSRRAPSHAAVEVSSLSGVPGQPPGRAAGR